MAAPQPSWLLNVLTFGLCCIRDPFIWRDHRGNFHCIFHKFTDEHPSCGGHAFSRDGFSWTLTNDWAYNTTIFLSDGNSVNFNRRERPHLLFEKAVRRLCSTITMTASAALNCSESANNCLYCLAFCRQMMRLAMVPQSCCLRLSQIGTLPELWAPLATRPSLSDKQ